MLEFWGAVLPSCMCTRSGSEGLDSAQMVSSFFPFPGALTQAIRNFAKSLEGWLSNAMNAIPQPMIQTKVGGETFKFKFLEGSCPWIRTPACASLQIAAVSAFAQTLRRYTSLNHLAQAARAVLQNTSQINQMLSDLNRVDFANVQVRRTLIRGWT